MNFLIYHPGNVLKIPIKYINEEDCVDLRRGSFLVYVNHFIDCVVDAGVPVPQYITIDVSSANRFSVFGLKEIQAVLPEGVYIHKKVPKNYVVGTIKSATQN